MNEVVDDGDDEMITYPAGSSRVFPFYIQCTLHIIITSSIIIIYLYQYHQFILVNQSGDLLDGRRHIGGKLGDALRADQREQITAAHQRDENADSCRARLRKIARRQLVK